MKIATWNVNSLKIRLPQILDWLAANPEVEALCLQETKLEDHNFPADAFEQTGFHVAYAGQKTYNGVAIIARSPLRDICINIPDFADAQKRLIAATLGDLRLICAYVPNGQALDSDKYVYKLEWLSALTCWLKTELNQHPKLALLGDYNIAPEDCDVHDPSKWANQVLVSAPERAAFRRFQDLGLQDAFRLFEQQEKTFSWWDYRGFSFQKNAGLRIDHILLSPALAASCSGCEIDRQARKHERPSDHAPVVATLENDVIAPSLP